MSDSLAELLMFPKTDESHGIKPFEFKVLVKPNKVEERTKGGIIRPDQVKDQMQVAVSKGRIVAVSPFAFTYFDPEVSTYEEVLERWPSTPKIGDMVIFGRYCGAEIWGDDDEKYRIMNDKDIMAVVSEKVAANEAEYE